MARKRVAHHRTVYARRRCDNRRHDDDRRRDEVLQPLRLRPPRVPRARRRHAAAPRLRRVRDDPLPEPEGRRRLPARVGGQGAAVQARDRAASRPVDAAGGLPRERRVAVAGGMRETLEEAHARVEIDELYTVISLPQINQVYMMFRARLEDLDFGPGPESLDVRLYRRSRHPVGVARVPDDHAHAAQLVPRPQAGHVSAARVDARAPAAAARSRRRGLSGALCRCRRSSKLALGESRRAGSRRCVACRRPRRTNLWRIA